MHVVHCHSQGGGWKFFYQLLSVSNTWLATSKMIARVVDGSIPQTLHADVPPTPISCMGERWSMSECVFMCVCVWLTVSETAEFLRLSEMQGPITPHTFISLGHYKGIKNTQVKEAHERKHLYWDKVQVWDLTLTSKEPLKAILKCCPWASFANTFCHVCLNSEVLKESPMIMWPLWEWRGGKGGGEGRG